jgi:erythromycin esterase-like protein
MIDPDQYDGFATPEELNLTPEEIEELRKSKRELTAYAQQKLRKLKMNNIAQKCVSAARNVAEGSPTLGKLIREGKDPIQAKVFYEYGAVLKTLVEELGYDNFNIDGDHGMLVINVRDVLGIIEILEAL